MKEYNSLPSTSFGIWIKKKKMKKRKIVIKIGMLEIHRLLELEETF